MLIVLNYRVAILRGETFEEVIENIKDAIKLHVEDRLTNNEPVTPSEIVSLSSIEVTAESEVTQGHR
ncbi:MAG: type II toxin-antitoxin system HicB family antitoxin [Dehalococcoidales bacterium]|nr:type II toxin-antitoxin system HicB family antitoxin [Dehalococcoidales bacterium]